MKKINILIVEDEVLIAQCLKMDLELLGFDVCDYVGSGEESIHKAKEKDPDVILMDINLSGEMDGIDAAKEIISFKKIPIIFCTGYGQRELYDRAQKLNPVAFLRKPVILNEMKSHIDSIFSM
ncbi:MAG: response regulator [Candidatus Tenebribacter davisii]|jgi:CheY-like chemotaxis protein|nr:response regulator [Candidatus Tenebribacter davisii]